ncbi:MAG: ankyrin repeat domain-containing protein [Phycisphaerales bacterium]|nr:ankyrin repeat domain-containing protein [Phycisphaerales bacterium]
MMSPIRHPHASTRIAAALAIAGVLLAAGPVAAQVQSPEQAQARRLTQAGVSATDATGRTALHYAALANDKTQILELLTAGADVNATDVWGDTPLHTAARRLRVLAADLLIAHDADVNARNDADQTPLLLSAAQWTRSPEFDHQLALFADVLIQHGADVNARDGRDCTALQYAVDRGHDRLAAMLLAAGGKLGSGDTGGTRDKADYHTYSEVEAELADAAANYPAITRLINLGQTVQGRDMWALCITDNPDTQEDEPEFKYISTMHGDEIIGVEMCLFLIDHLLTNYGSDPRITNIIDEVELWIIPCMNPDGFVSGNRYNANWVDLNRDFPDPYTSPNNTPAGRAIETANIMNWSFDHSFALAANFHSGALVVNYPFDNNASGSSVYTASPDDDLFIWISEEYSQHNSPMWNSPYFYHGITNGADWYAIAGGMQDWDYVYMGGNEVTIELADNDPPSSQIPTYWNNNRESMLSYIETVFIGVRGVVTDAQTALPVAATITVVGRDHNVYTDPDVGDYCRMLLPGTYDLRFEADNYDPMLVTGVIVAASDATRLDIALGPPAQVTAPNGGEQLPVGTPTLVEWTGHPDAQFHVQYTLNADDLTTIVDDFETGSLDPAYTTGGSAPWYVTTSSSHSGAYAARAGNISHNQTSYMTRDVNSGGDMSFWYRVSSEANYDFFNFYIDGDRKLHLAGNVAWQQYVTTLDPGSHELKWEYTKDVNTSDGSDTVWIDDLELVDDGAVWTDIIALTDPGVMSTSWSPPSETEAGLVRVRAYYGSNIYGEWDQSDDVFSIIEGGCPGDLDGDNDVDQADLGILLSAYGNSAAGDCDGDGDTDQADLGILLSNYGTNCT